MLPRPQRILLTAAAIFLGGALLLWVPASTSGQEEDPAPREAKPELEILATTQSLGALEPCDCVEGMLGGYPRRLSLIRKLRGEAKSTVVLDGGDLTGKAFHPRLLEVKTRAALDLLRQAGVTVVGVGERDLRLGVETLRRLAQQAGVHLVADNVYRGEGQETPFPGIPARQIGEQTLLVFGVLDPDLGDPTGELRIGDPAEAIRSVLSRRELTPSTRVVVLFHGTAEAAREKLIEPGLGGRVDLIIAGHDQQRALPASQVGSTWIVEALRDARALTRIDLRGSGVLVRHVPLDEHTPDDAQARARVDRYFADVQGLPEPPRQPTQGGQFVGSETCQVCHMEAWEVFTKTKHHQAQRRILAAKPGRAASPECTVCHVVGFGFEGGFTDLQTTPGLAEVGCESCHGVGGNHVTRGGERGFGMRPGFPGSWKPLCVTCHDPTNSPHFDFEKGLEAIRHWEDRGD